MVKRSGRVLTNRHVALAVMGALIASGLPVGAALAASTPGDVPDAPKLVSAPAAPALTAVDRKIPLAPRSEIQWEYGVPPVPATPKEAPTVGVLLPEEGAPTVDVYGVGEVDASHLAVVDLDVVNRETAATV